MVSELFFIELHEKRNITDNNEKISFININFSQYFELKQHKNLKVETSTLNFLFFVIFEIRNLFKRIAMRDTLCTKHTKTLNITSELLFIFLIFGWLNFQYSDYLFLSQELSVFLSNGEFFNQFFLKPGGISLYIGSFLTQFFYYPILGISIFVVGLLLIQFLTIKTFKLSCNRFVLSLIPISILVVSVTQNGYMIYIMKTPDMMFTQIFGVIIMLIYCFISSLLKRTEIRLLWILIGSLLLYPIAGVYAIAASIISVFIFMRNNNGKFMSAVESIGSIMIISAVVMGYYQYIYSLNLLRCWINPLPDYLFRKEEFILWLPYILILFSMIIFAVLPERINNIQKIKLLNNSFVRSSSILIICLGYIYWGSFKDESLFTELKVDKAIEEQKWDEALTYIRNIKGEPTRKLILERNLCLFHTNDLGNRMFSYKEGQKLPNSPRAIFLVSLTSRPIYYNYGKFCFCYRWCMEDAVEYGFRVQFLKYLTKCAIASGELRVAKKYINTLKQTTFHKEWAEEYEVFINEPAKIAKDDKFKPFLKINGFENKIGSDGAKIELYLLEDFSSLTKGCFELSELSLVSTLVLKNIDTFWPRCFYYFQNKGELPKHYQEAAVLYEYLEKKVDTKPLNINPAIRARLEAFFKITEYYKTDDLEFLRPH